MAVAMTKVMLVTPGDAGRSETRPFVAALEQELETRVVAWTGGPWPNTGEADAVISFVKFRHLFRADTLDWGGFEGLRVHYDWDALQDGNWTGSPYSGTWAPTLKRQRFDLAITTGLRARDGLRAQGIDAEAVAKASDPAIRDLGGDRPVLYGTYGYDYPSRALMKSELRRAGIRAQAFKVPFTALAAELNRYVAVLTCTLDARLRLPVLGRRLYPYAPRLFVVPGEAPEPMIKFFEVAAAGAAPFVDWTPDLEGLGFVDGANAVIYRSLDELVERALHYGDRPDELRRIGQAAGTLTAERHTWTNRVEEIRRLVEDRLSAR